MRAINGAFFFGSIKLRNINICLSCDDNYAPFAGVVIVSALLNSAKDEKLTFYVLQSGLSEDNKEKLLFLKKIKECEINFIEIPQDSIEQFKKIKTLAHITIPAYYRLMIASFIKDIDRILYLDCDVIVEKSLSEFYFSDFGDNFCAGVRDLNLGKTKFYVNSGVLLFNLKYWREKNAEKMIFEHIEKNQSTIVLGDQQVLNEVFAGKILELPPMWNVQTLNFYSFSNYEPKYGIIHFIGTSKPWLFGSFMPFKRKYFYYLSKTPWGAPDFFWRVVSNIYSYLRYLKRVPFFFLRPRFFLALKNAMIRSFFAD